jgi:hypothetical protein
VNGIVLVFIESVGLLVTIGLLLIMIALMGWGGWALGGAIGSQFGEKKDSEDNGGFIGMVIGILVGVYLLFFA